MRYILVTAAFATTLLAACQPAVEEAKVAPHQSYDAKAFFDTTAVSMPYATPYAFSLDGANLLVATDKSGVFNANALPVTGGEPTPLTQSTTNATFAISYFPTDDRILVASDGGGNELSHLYVREADATLKDITPGDKHTADFLGWSGDGKSFWVASNERDPQMFDVYTYDTATFARKLVFQNSGFFPSAISPDGKWLALSKQNTSADSDVYLADLTKPATQTPVLITPNDATIAYGVYEFTPDSKSLIYATDEFGEFMQAWTHDLATGQKAELLKADWDVMFVTYSPSGKYRVDAINADASTKITILDQTAGKPLALTGVPDGDINSVRFNRSETHIAFTVSSDTSPADVFVADLSTGAATRMTTNLNPAIDEQMLVQTEVVRYKSFDGLDIPAILFKPKGASAETPVPAVVDVHGGPGGQNRKGYTAMYQHLANQGYAVLRVNNRGSSGYGKTFFHMDDKKHGEVDLDDVVHGKKYLQSLDWVQKDKIAIMGGSYGGYMVAAALAFRPEEFNAGIDIFGVTNWTRTLQQIPAWWGAQKTALYDEMGDPATDAERHTRISPLFHADKITKPLLVIQGKNDPRVLQVESDELVAAVKKNNVPVEYIIFPDEGHGFLRKENRITASNAYVTFLNQYLKGVTPPAGAYASPADPAAPVAPAAPAP
ncbi:MAG: S9 family peptidase [Hyphomonadaceae bacterium]|nr:S9 family peptidase [Hyphomonadaceae bacterium]